jgi:uncharacterized protein YjiS (DUF1127 family)
MPTHQTNLASETQRDAAGLGRDLSIALLQGAMGGGSAAARPHAGVAALDDACPQDAAAGPAAASARSGLSWLRRVWRGYQERRRRQRLRATLYGLSDRELMDIGVTRAEIDYLAPHRAIDRLRDGSTYVWMLSRGVM